MTTPGWKPYDLDYYAQQLVLRFRDTKDVLNESHKMRMTVAYGLERFWGEHLRLERDKPDKAKYWKADEVKSNSSDKEKRKQEETEKIRNMSQKIWSMSLEDQRVALMVLTQFCDSLVWWTQRYKTKGDKDND
jgi:Fe-S cluster assembly scaffold protein SufB